MIKQSPVVKRFNPPNRLGALVLNKGGKTRSHAVADAAVLIEAGRGNAESGIIDAIGAMEDAVEAAQGAQITTEQLHEIFSMTDRIVTLADAYELRHVNAVAQSLGGLISVLLESPARAADPIKVHVRAARLLAPGGPKLDDAATQSVLSELARVRDHFVR